MIYSIWNNKGGVGKTFLSFIVGCEYAFFNPNKQIIVMDLCPQANVSEIFLGGNGNGSDVLSKILKESKRKTIGGYFDARINSPHNRTGNEADYLTSNLRQYNPNLPENIHLVVGDPSLELQAQAINQISAQTLPVGSWTNVHRWLMDLIAGIKSRLSDTVFFIDCNPSFAAYTELAILASDRLIVPCTADGSSARAIDNIGGLIYGVNIPPEYREVNFSKKAKDNKFALPSIHIVSLNRSTQYDKRASKGFLAMFDEIKKRTKILEKNGIPFSSNEEIRFLDVPDAHTVSVVCSHLGVPLSKLQMGKHQIHGLIVQVNPEPYQRYKQSIDRLVSIL